MKEKRVEYEVREANLKLEAVQLRGKLRLLGEDKGLGGLLESFEKHIQRFEIIRRAPPLLSNVNYVVGCKMRTMLSESAT